MSRRPQLDTLFPDPAAVSAGRRARRVRKAGAAVGVLVLLSGGVGIAQAASAAPLAYRTSAVGDHDVQSLLTTVGTVEAVSQAAVAFPTSGTVATVDVAVGDTVVVGETLATLDATDLTETLHTKQAALAQAELVLSKALNGESTATVGAGSTGAAPSTGSSSSATAAVAAVTTTTAAPATTPSTATDAAASPTSTDADAIRNAQQTVVDGQKAVDAALNEANQALAAADTVCADLDSALAALAATTSTTTTADPTTTTTNAATTTTTVDTASCRTALAAVRSAQTAAATAQQQLSTAATTLDDLLATSASAAISGSSATTNTNAANAASPNTASPNTAPTSTASTSTASAGTASTVSSEELIADQKAVDAAAVDVIAAQQALNQDVLVAPIAGTVIGVGLATGDSVTAASSTAVITIVGEGGYEVTTTVSVDDVTDLAVGQSATFLVDGSADELDGEIVSIGVAPASGSTSYPVTIALSSPADDLRNGATGTVAIVTAATTAARSVPTSAVTTDGDRHTVTVLSGTTTEEVAVEVGVVGATWTEVTSGLDEGDEVVLAALDEELPGSATDTSSSSSTSGTSAGPGGFTGSPPAGMGGTGGPPTG